MRSALRAALLAAPLVGACVSETEPVDSGIDFEIRGDIQGTVADHEFGELTTAFLIPDSQYYSLKLPLIFLADQGFTCDEIQLASATAELLRTLDPLQTWAGLLLWFGYQDEEGNWTYPDGAGTWAINSAELSPNVAVGSTVRVLGFGHGQTVQLDPSYLTIDALDLSASASGSVELYLETGEQVSGSFEAEYCNLPGTPTVF